MLQATAGAISLCAAISENGVSTHIPNIGPYNTQKLLTFLDTLYRDLIPENEGGLIRHDFHHTNAIREWLAVHQRMLMVFLPPYSPFLNPIEEFFSAWRWKVYDHRPHNQMSLLAAMDAACDGITAEHCRGWLRHARRFFPRCIARENLRCDVDENLWPDRQERQDIQ